MTSAPDLAMPTTIAATAPAKAAAPPRIRLSSHGFSVDHPDPELGEQLMANALGATDREAMDGILRQLVRASVSGGSPVPFDVTPLLVDHGLDGDRLGRYDVENIWTLDQLGNSAIEREIPATSWKELVEAARRRFPRLLIPDSVYQDQRLAREPFEAAIRDRAIALLGHLDLYMSDRLPTGEEGATARSVDKRDGIS